MITLNVYVKIKNFLQTRKNKKQKKKTFACNAVFADVLRFGSQQVFCTNWLFADFWRKQIYFI